MDVQYLKKIIRLLEQSSVDEIEIEEEGTKIRIARRSNHQASPIPASVAPMPAPPALPEPPQAAPVLPKEPAYHEIKSPIVGTFYRAPAPDADSYVEPGQIVQAGSVLCIIEAMKLMNEIESDVAGKVVKILVENGKPVEYNQPLFLIEPA